MSTNKTVFNNNEIQISGQFEIWRDNFYRKKEAVMHWIPWTVIIMKLLCLSVVLIITVIKCVTAETTPNQFFGPWIALAMYVEGVQQVHQSKLKCFTVHLFNSKKKCSCEGIPMTFFIVNVTFPYLNINVLRRKSVFIVDTYDEAFDAAHRQCNCGAKDFNVFRQLDSNHYLSYFQSRGTKVLDAVLLSRQMPTRREMEEYEVQHFPEFKEKDRMPICTKRIFKNRL